MKTLITGTLGAALLFAGSAIGGEDDALKTAIAHADRGEDSARDEYRNPYETLKFFGIKPDMHVLEIWPGDSGWYTGILAPYLAEDGELTMAVFGENANHERFADYMHDADKKITAKFVESDKFGTINVAHMYGDAGTDLGADNSYDMIVTFRNLHNWMAWDQLKTNLDAMYAALKPGGILGVTDHRANPALPIDATARNGYVDEAHAIQIIQKAGFKLVATSDINDNPKDTKDYPAGVWSLPPTYALGDQDKDKYQAIGESDRFTLKFVKPE